MKGIILAGGKGSRLYPMTLSVCKQLLPVYDKPMIYYPLSVLMLAGIREILIISTPEDLPRFRSLFGNGSHLGLDIQYTVQASPDGIAQAFTLGASFIGNEPVCLILGDNLFYGHNLRGLLSSCSQLEKGAVIFGYEVKDPGNYGVIAYDSQGNVTDIVEKPKIPPSHHAVTGLYFYDESVVEIAKALKPSGRGEYEITHVNQVYLKRGELEVKHLPRGFAWLDTGTHAALHQASSYVQAIQARQGIMIACLEEIACEMGFISPEQLLYLGEKLSTSPYGIYLQQRATELTLRPVGVL